jgi:hypothetical protein
MKIILDEALKTYDWEDEEDKDDLHNAVLVHSWTWWHV